MLDAGGCRAVPSPESIAKFSQRRAGSKRARGEAMQHARPLPEALVARYRAWQTRRTPDDLAAYAEAAGKAQNPKAMIITCCDSRVLVSEIFGTRARRLLHPPQHRQPRAAARARRPLARHLGRHRIRGHRARHRAPDGHGPPRLRRRARLPRHARGPRARARHPDELRRHLAPAAEARLRGAGRTRAELRGADHHPREGGGAGQPRRT